MIALDDIIIISSKINVWHVVLFLVNLKIEVLFLQELERKLDDMTLNVFGLLDVHVPVWIFYDHVFYVLDGLHLVIRIAAEYRAIYFSIAFSVDSDLFPDYFVVEVLTYLFRKSEMFHVEVNP